MTQQDTEKAGQALAHLLSLQNTLGTYGGMVTAEEWRDTETYKYAIVRTFPRDELAIRMLTHTALPLSFHTREQAERFMKTFEHEIKKYYMFFNTNCNE